MWNEKLEEHAARMRARTPKMVEHLRVRPERKKKPRVEKKPKVLKRTRKERRQYVSCRITDEQRREGLRKSWTNKKAHGDVHRHNVTELVVTEPTVRLKGIKSPLKECYPPCPHYTGSQPGGTIRAGLSNGIQRYRCSLCRKTFSGPTVVIRLEPFDYKMICYHCGSDEVKRLGKGLSKSRSGRLGLCLKCDRKFVQGGLKDLQKYHLLLESRIAELKLPDEVEAELLQMACEGVLIGKGYCWTVELRVKEAWREVRGEYNQRGSDHPAFKRQQGQKAQYDS